MGKSFVMINWEQFIDLLSLVIWPLFIAILLFIFRNYLFTIINSIKKISFAGIELSFLKAKAFTKNQKFIGDRLNEIGNMTNFQNLQSDISFLIDSSENINEVDYVIIDLGDGKNWLTSRLYLVSILFKEIKRMKCVVFVKSDKKGTQIKFLGYAIPDDIRLALNLSYKEYEPAYIKSVAKVTNGQYKLDLFDTNSWANLIITFVQNITSEPVILKNNTIESLGDEAASWLTKGNISDYLAEKLVTNKIKDHWSKNKKIKNALRKKGDFVAMVSRNNSFVGLIDRKRLVEEIIKLSVFE